LSALEIIIVLKCETAFIQVMKKTHMEKIIPVLLSVKHLVSYSFS